MDSESDPNVKAVMGDAKLADGSPQAAAERPADKGNGGAGGGPSPGTGPVVLAPQAQAPAQVAPSSVRRTYLPCDIRVAYRHMRMGDPRSGYPYDYCYEGKAGRILGLTRQSFRKLGLVPARIVPNPYRMSGKARLFSRAEIEAMRNDPEIVALRQKPRRSRD